MRWNEWLIQRDEKFRSFLGVERKFGLVQLEGQCFAVFYDVIYLPFGWGSV